MLTMSQTDELKKLLPASDNRLTADEPMKNHTTFRLGGPADLYFEPANSEEIVKVARYCRENEIALTVLGNGSNVLVSDQGIRGVVMAIGDSMADIERRDDLLLAGAGTRLSALAAFAAQNGLAGLEFGAGIPGTLGGAILMNAGAYDHCMAEIVVLTEFLDGQFDLQAKVRAEHAFAYRHSYFSDNSSIILRACIQLCPDEPQAILARMADLGIRRRTSQPMDLPSAGSAFKRPPGFFAGKLISECGLQGCRVGQAQVSEKHAGFIVNLGDASASDTRRLFEHVRKTVWEKTGVQLEPEVRFVGDWLDWETRPIEHEVI